MTLRKILPAALVALALISTMAQAQTPSTPSGSVSSMPPLPVVRPVPGVRPVPQSVVDQARAQTEGNFTTMKRASVGGQIQEAWDRASNTNGVFRFQYCKHCTYKVRLREHMVTVIELPTGETIEKADVGDTAAFQVEMRGANLLAVKPTGFGIDTNLIVYGKSGALYPIYLRAESFNSKNIPDLLVRIEGTIPDTGGTPNTGGIPNTATGPDVISPMQETEPSDVEVAELPPLQAKGDFVQEAPFDPDSLRGWGDYKLWSGGTNGADLKPETVFRDDYFTYIRFGEKWKDLELPTAYVVVDGIDELVNTRVKGRTFIVESTQKLITLKSGESYLCIEYGGES